MMQFLILLALVVAATAGADYEKKLKALQNPDLYDGDMISISGRFVSVPYDRFLISVDPDRNAIKGDKYRWPNAKVPYVIDQALLNHSAVILKGMKNYHDHTCARFVPRTTKKDYVKIFQGDGCHARVGRAGGQQTLSLGDECLYVGTVIHELGHALGIYHEHNRSDRDDFLTIYYKNIQEGSYNKKMLFLIHSF
ncbi:zinc metalloproteinase nas-8 [Caerostris extrusa]|uniref:Metalloendopeptidase n=1 Tax=Caerostris extrusa TaxID=172846 RepID=A0AAV4NLA1_CAEEX|nr:zinc metalloproteinase nas-8 [Caerostris extrusa]